MKADQWIYWRRGTLATGSIGRALIAIRDQPIAAETTYQLRMMFRSSR